jgi:hypothetical protein
MHLLYRATVLPIHPFTPTHRNLVGKIAIMLAAGQAAVNKGKSR